MRAQNWQMQYIAEHMRPDEIEHWLAITGEKEYSPEVAAAAMIATVGVKFSLVDDLGVPVVVGGFVQESTGCYSLWMCGTIEGWNRRWRSITKSCRALIGALFEDGARRVFISTIASRTAAQDWYVNGLGLIYEGRHREAGAKGEDIVFFSRVTKDIAP